MVQHKEKIDGAVSYCTSALCVFLGKIVEIQDELTALTVLVGLILALVRLAYDIRRYWRGRK